MKKINLFAILMMVVGLTFISCDLPAKTDSTDDVTTDYRQIILKRTHIYPQTRIYEGKEYICTEEMYETENWAGMAQLVPPSEIYGGWDKDIGICYYMNDPISISADFDRAENVLNISFWNVDEEYRESSAGVVQTNNGERIEYRIDFIN